MDHDIHGERDAMLADALRQLQFGGVRACAGDLICLRLLGILEAELDMIQAGGHQSFQARFAKSNSRSDEVDVQARRSSGLHQLLGIRPRQRLAAGKMQLQHAQGRRFAENAPPFRGAQLLGARTHLQRIGTVDAAQRAAMGDFGDQARAAQNS